MELDHAREVEEALEEAVEEVYGRVYRLMKPAKFLRRPRRSYDVTVGGRKVHVGVKKKCFIIRRSPPPVAGCRNRVNKWGDLTIGFGHGRPTQVPATLAQTKKAWKLVLDVLGIGENDLRRDHPNTHTEGRGLEEELSGTSCDEGSDEGSGDETDPEMPDLWPAEVTAENRNDNHVAASPDPQAMQATAGSSTDVPGNTYVGPFWEVGQGPFHFPSATPYLQPADTTVHQQVAIRYRQRYALLSTSCSHTRMATRHLWQVLFPLQRYTLHSSDQETMRAWTLRAYLAADIAMQPDSAEMITAIVGPDHKDPNLAAMTARASPCRELAAIWHKPFYLRLMLAAWKQVSEENWRASRACGEAKKPRTE